MPPEADRAAGARLWRGVAVAALVLLVVSLVAGLLWFFADPLHLPPHLLAVLDQRASVVGMFAGVGIGVAALVVAVVALRAQTRAASTPPAAVSTGDGVRNGQMSAEVSGQGRVYQAGGDQTIHEGDDHRRTYGGDHIEFHHNTFPGKVIGKQVSGPEPAPSDEGDDGRR